MQGVMRTQLVSLEKKGNVVYAQLENTLYNVTVDDEPHPEYHLVRELVLISTPSDLYIVKTLVPSADYRSDAPRWIMEWFGQFAIPSQTMVAWAR